MDPVVVEDKVAEIINHLEAGETLLEDLSRATSGDIDGAITIKMRNVILNLESMVDQLQNIVIV